MEVCIPEKGTSNHSLPSYGKVTYMYTIRLGCTRNLHMSNRCCLLQGFCVCIHSHSLLNYLPSLSAFVFPSSWICIRSLSHYKSTRSMLPLRSRWTGSRRSLRHSTIKMNGADVHRWPICREQWSCNNSFRCTHEPILCTRQLQTSKWSLPCAHMYHTCTTSSMSTILIYIYMCVYVCTTGHKI